MNITNRDGCITVHDNGRGIDDFAKLLDLGGSGWDEHLEASEDPAGVGLFCLARREVTLRSRGKMVTIGGGGWTGAPVKVHADPNPVSGTWLQFHDEEWTPAEVARCAVFSSMDLTAEPTGIRLTRTRVVQTVRRLIRIGAQSASRVLL